MDSTDKELASGTRRGSIWTARVAGVLVALVGLAVIAGWCFHQQALVQLRPQFAPMQFNTAFCLALFGFALLGLSFHRPRLGLVLAIVGGLFGFGTLLEYELSQNLGLDELLFKSYILDGASSPGRMSPPTAICFFLIGLTFALMRATRNRRTCALLLALLASATSAICTMAVFGYSTGLDAAYSWGTLTAMALHSALCILCLSCGLFAWAWQLECPRRSEMPRWLPLPVLLGGVVATIVLSHALRDKQEAGIQRTIRATAANITNQVTLQMDSRLRALDRMGIRFAYGEGMPEAEWHDDAHHYILDFQGFRAIEWMDAASVIRWVEPLQGNEQALNLDLTKESRRHSAVLAARNRKTPTLTRPIRLVQGGAGFLGYIPIHKEDRSFGLIVGVFESKSLFESILPDFIAPGYGVSVRDGPETIFARRTALPEEMGKWAIDTNLSFYGVNWAVRVWPSPRVLADQHSPLPGAILAAGIAAALLLALSIFLAQHAYTQAREARRTARELAASEELFRRAFQDAPIGIALAAPNGRWLKVNQAFCDMLGYTNEEMLATDYQSTTHPDDLNSDLALVERLIRGDIDSYDYEKRYLTKDGAVVNVLLSGSLVRDGEGMPLYFIALIQNITERKRTQEILRSNEERFRLLFESLTDYAVLMLDPQGHVVSWNAGAQRLKGYDANEVIGRHFSVFYGTDDLETDLAANELARAIREGRSEHEGWRVRKDGTRFWANTILTAIRDEQGELRGFAKITRDLTERRNAAEALSATLALQNAVLNNAAYSIVAAEPNGIITIFNDTAEKMLGYAAEEMIGRQTPAAIHVPKEVEARATEFSAELGQAVEPGFETFVIKSRLGLPNEHEWTYVRKDGTTFPVLLGVTALRNEKGEITGYLGIANNITERKREEEERRRLQKLLEKNNQNLLRQNREIQNFYHTLSHELKTPLTSTREFIAIVLDGLAGQISETQYEYLTIARDGCKQLQVCINDLIDVTRLETGKLSVLPKPVALDHLCQRIVSSLAPAAEQRQLRLSLNAAHDLPLVPLDEARISQVLINLLNNAFKFTPAGGSVSVRVQRSAADSEFAEISVTDTGRGIPSDKLSHIFERLYQVKESDASTEQGLGLGLYICRELIQLHGGWIEVKSQPFKGSTFSFFLPLTQRSAVRSALLLVDDDPQICEILRHAFEPAGFKVSVAHDGRAAWHAFSKDRPDLLVADLKMPDMDGATLLQRVRAKAPNLPVILHTGYPDSEWMERARQFPPFTVLPKPCSVDKMVAAARAELCSADGARP